MNVITNDITRACCICCTNSSEEFFDINESFQNNLITIEFIIKDLLGSIEVGKIKTN